MSASSTQGIKTVLHPVSDVARAKIIRRESRRDSVSPSVTAQDDETRDQENRRRRDTVKIPKDDGLYQIHREERRFSARQIRDPGPEDTAHSIAQADDAYESRCRNRAHFAQLLEHRRRLRNDRYARDGIDRQ